MRKLVISSRFTIEDIHRVRENNYNLTKNMTIQEKKDFYNKRGLKVQKEIEIMRSND